MRLRFFRHECRIRKDRRWSQPCQEMFWPDKSLHMWGQTPSAVYGSKTCLIRIENTNGGQHQQSSFARRTAEGGCPHTEQDIAFLRLGRRALLTGAILSGVSMRYPFPLD